jgi:protein-S-isoprenylcysteine O-methyltransferase Ste14
VRRSMAILGSALFFVAVPAVLAGVVPWWITHWRPEPAFLGIEATRAIGVILILAGVPQLVDSFARFAVQGLGTPAPIAPTKHLVVTGFYRHVRNPMYVAVLAIIIGQALLFADVRLIVYGAVFWLSTHLFVLAYEEPTLRQTFGAEYEAFCANVPRWIPRLSPWRGGDA